MNCVGEELDGQLVAGAAQANDNAEPEMKKPGTGPVSDEVCGGEEEDRTPDLRIANATLSQLSYPPDTSG